MARVDLPRPDSILGFYGPDSMMWRINREAVLLGAGPTALLLQIAHPQVAQGVAEHSSFAADPFKRLHGTITTTMDLVFGDAVAAERAVRRLNGIHATVKGENYRALDPELLLWVQVTLIITSVRAYHRWVAPLTKPELEQFWQEARSVGTRLGIPLSLSPADWTALAAYWRRMLSPDGPIHVTPTAKRLAPMIMRPPLPRVPGMAIDFLALPGLALLPRRLREEFGLPWDFAREALSRSSDKFLKAWVRSAPVSVRSMPQAREAYRRAKSEGVDMERPPSTRSSAPVM